MGSCISNMVRKGPFGMKSSYFHFLLLLLTIQVDANGPEDDCGGKCCKRKQVGEDTYTFSHQNEIATKEYNCTNNCIYTNDKDGTLFCFKPGNMTVDCKKCRKLPGLPKKYCQPGQECWPNVTAIANFSKIIDGNKLSCLKLKKFYSFDDPSAHQQICLHYTGLIPENNCSRQRSNDYRPNTGNYLSPDPNCDPNPFVTGAFYNKKGLACMTPYQFLNNRNYKQEWMAAFIVTAENEEDIKHAVLFAKEHNLGISVMSTGHDLQDRNAGPGPNTLLIRTTCFRNWTAVTNNKTIKDAHGKEWEEGYAIVGAGLSFGMNFWTDIKNAKGTYELAMEANREMVGGTCHSVGIVGWTLGGGRGWTSPKYGLGVDNLIEANLVDANGDFLTVSPTQNKKLFYAIRGGGGGFGIIVNLTVKLHYPSCNDSSGYTMKDCYTMNVYNWTGKYDEQETPNYIKKIVKAYINWSIGHRHSWNSIVQFYYRNTSHYEGENEYSIQIGANHFGYEKDSSFETTFNNTEFKKHRTIPKPYPIKTNKYFCEIFPDPTNTSNCTEHPWDVKRWPQSIRFMVNSSASNSTAFIDDMLKHWQPLCDKYPYAPCASGYQIHGDLPAINPQTNLGVHDTGGPISSGFREASFQVFNLGVNSAKINLTFVQEEEWMHYTLAPALYKYSNASYFNEAEYTLDPGQWERRFWGKENHCKLLEHKHKYDPDFIFACRHCVGSEVGSEPGEK